MKIKKFEDINESSHVVSEEFSKILSGKLQRFLISVKGLVQNYAENIIFRAKKDSQDSYKISTKVPLESEYKTYVHNILSDNIEDYDNLVGVGEDNPGARHIDLKFEIDGELYKIPLILTMSSGDMIYRNHLEYGFWLNTVVAQKV